MVHYKLHPFRGGIFLQFLYIEIRVRGNKIKYILFPLTEPVFPSDIPPLNKNAVEPVLRGIVDVEFGSLRCGAVPAVRLQLQPVCLTDLHIVNIGVVPAGFTDMQLPPYPEIFVRLYPADILDLRWLVKVEDQLR